MNDNKTIKVLRILTLSLTLMLLVFALAKKVGLCASDSSDVITVTEFPLYYGGGFGVAGPIPLEAVVTYCNSLDVGVQMLRNNRLITIYEYTDSSNFTCFYYGNPDFLASDGTIRNEPTFTLSDRFIVGAFGYRYTITCSNGTYSASYEGRGYTVYCNLNTILEANPAGGFSYKSGTYLDYPLWFSDGYSLDFANTGNPAFTRYTSGGGIDSPGFSDAFDDAYQDWVDGNYNPVDTNAPTNNTSTPAWLQSILNGLGTLNNTIGGGFATIFNKLKDFTSGVFDFFNDKVVPFFDGIIEVTEDIKDILSGSLESDNDIYQAWVDGYEDSVFYDFSNIVSSCKNILTSIFNASTPSTLSFSIPTYPINIPTTSGSSNYVYLFGQSISIDFSWYRSPIFGGRSIYDMVNSVFFTFLYVGFLAALFFKVPSLIHGASGFSRSMHGDYNQSIGNASGTPSNSKYDFAAMTQFILDN